MENKIEESGLVVLLKNHQIPEETALELSSSFSEFYNLANEWNSKATAFLSDPDLSDEQKAAEARKARLSLVKVRTGIEKKRKELNEEDNLKITNRNSAAKVLTALVTPTEKILQDKEDEAEKKVEAELNRIKNERLEKIAPYDVDCTFFDLKNMPEEAFVVLLDNSRLAFEKKQDEINKNREKEEKEKRFTNRLVRLTNIGFYFDPQSSSFIHEVGCINQEASFIDNINDSTFEEYFSKAKQQIDDLQKIIDDEKKAEENRLKAEKEELERKNALLQQQEKERQNKHNAAIARQEMLAKINVAISYEAASEMEDPDFQEMYQEENSKYQAEQNRLFIEKKKKEREEAAVKLKQERVQKRIDQLIVFGFEFAEMRAEWFKKEPEFQVSIYIIENHSIEDWDRLMIEYVRAVEDKREAELAPDKVKLQVFVDRVHNIVKEFEKNEFKTPEAEKIYKDFFGMMLRANQWANEKINLMK